LQRKTQLDALAERLRRAPRQLWQQESERLGKAGKLLGALGYKQVLGRGYAVVRNAAHQPLRSAALAGAEARLSLEFADGTIEVTPGPGAAPETGKAPSRPARTKSGADQGNLF
jgi:exodeoxyribonuclease VII large subunit